MGLHPVEPKALTSEVFQAFATQNTLLTAGDRTRCNPMTIGWCQLGRLWSQPVCTVYVRPERHTYSFMEAQDYFTVSLLGEEASPILKLCGTRSGRELDKMKECGLTVGYGAGDAPFPQEAKAVLVCKKLYAQDLDPSCVLEQETILPFYGKPGGWHRMYTGQIVEAYVK